MKCSMLIVSEGAHELSSGHPDAALLALVSRLLGDGIEMEASSKRIREMKGHMHPGRGDRLGRKFIGIVRQAEREGFDAAVILIDHDGDNRRLKSATFAQEATITTLPRSIGIAIRTFDAWFLADQTALAKVLSMNVDRQPDPEGISDPKGVCQLLSNSAGRGRCLRDFYSEVAAIADLQMWRDRCPGGFALFAERVEGLVC